MRQVIVAGNWKMNMNLTAARAWVEAVRRGLPKPCAVEAAAFPPFVYLFPMAKAIDGSPIRMGAQNCWHETAGAFTGEVSPAMLKETGCTYVILGHSERRHTIGPPRGDGRVHGESDETVAAKCRAVLAAGLTPIVCIGERLEERDAGRTEEILSEQIAGSLGGVEHVHEACAQGAAHRLVIAYEPVWAIGTGRNATAEQAQAAHRHIRGRLAERYGREGAEVVPILYGGSVKPDNAAALMACPDVDGALIGGASLKADDFLAILRATLAAKGLAA